MSSASGHNYLVCKVWCQDNGIAMQTWPLNPDNTTNKMMYGLPTTRWGQQGPPTQSQMEELL